MTQIRSLVNRIDNAPRKGWYFAFLLAFNLFWGIVGRWPL